jgi:hypothetical protein
MLQAQPTKMLLSAHLISIEIELRKWLKTSNHIISRALSLRTIPPTLGALFSCFTLSYLSKLFHFTSSFFGFVRQGTRTPTKHLNQKT